VTGLAARDLARPSRSSASSIRAGISKLNGKQIGAPISADGVVCHKLGRANYFIVTGVDSKTGGMFCHMH
jgi:hypothetical protein